MQEKEERGIEVLDCFDMSQVVGGDAFSDAANALAGLVINGPNLPATPAVGGADPPGQLSGATGGTPVPPQVILPPPIIGP